MKRWTHCISLVAVLALLIVGCDTADNPVGGLEEGTTLSKKAPPAQNVLASATVITNGGTVDLVAGQHEVVGTVTVADDGTSLTVTYTITNPDYCLVETHLDVEDDLADIPQTQKGNPIPGQFADSGEHDCVSEVIYEVAIPENDGDLVVAAHAVVSTEPICQAEGILYGAERQSPAINGGLYAIDVVGGTATALFETGFQGGSSYSINSPNALGFDPATDRLYYMAVKESAPVKSDLYVWDAVNGQQSVGLSLDQVVVGAAFYNGSYYYIPNLTADLWKVDVNFDGSGTVTGFGPPINVYPDFNGASASVYRFGDIAITQDGILYGSSNGTSGSTAEFFSVDLSDGTFTLISNNPGDALGLQLSFGSNGILYAHNAGTGEFYEVDLATGGLTPVGTVSGTATLFSDLASGTLCVPETETAWGDGMNGARFVEQGNWGTYFEYLLITEYDNPFHQAIEETSDGAVRYRSFANTGGEEIYLGIHDLGIAANRIASEFTWSSGTHAVQFSYDADSDELTTDVDGTALTYSNISSNASCAGTWNTLNIQVFNRDVGTTVNFNNVMVEGVSLGDFSDVTGNGTGWQVSSLALSDGFTLIGELELGGTFSTSQELSKVQVAVGCTP